MKADKRRLEIAMARACFNTYDLAKLADMPLPTVNNVISGRSVKPATLGKLAKALKVDVIELIEEEKLVFDDKNTELQNGG